MTDHESLDTSRYFHGDGVPGQSPSAEGDVVERRTLAASRSDCQM